MRLFQFHKSQLGSDPAASLAWVRPQMFLLALLVLPLLAFGQAPELEARGYLLIDLTANQVLAEKNAAAAMEPASLTKLMSAYVVFDALKSKKLSLSQELPVSVRAWKMEGSRMFIDPKMRVKVEDLLKGMIVQSGNDATVALAEGVAGSVEGFIALMNQHAARLGLKNTRYHNPEGLTVSGHTTTAQDLSVLATRLMSDFPEFIHLYAIHHYRLEGSPKSNDINRNKLLFLDPTKTGFTVDGLKTGHTEAAGYCLVATAQKTTPSGERRLLSIVLGTTSEKARALESEKLLTWGFNNFELLQIFPSREAVTTARVWKGTINTVNLQSASNWKTTSLSIAVPSGMSQQVSAQLVRTDPVIAPVALGQTLATVKVSVAGKPFRDIPLTATQEVPLAGWFGRTWDGIRLMFN